jgi:[ribosomal protein S18]-alanine N-acetyltransferase
MSALVTVGDLVESELEAALEIDLTSFAPSELGAGPESVRVVRERSLREELARPWSRLRAARDAEGRVLGYALFWHVVDEVELLNVAVAIPERRSGIGLALMNDLLDYARANAVARILLEARAGNAAAIALYERLGFERFHVRERYYADGEDAIEMSLVIESAGLSS